MVTRPRHGLLYRTSKIRNEPCPVRKAEPVAACAVIIGLLVVPFSPASLNMVEWSIVIGWLAIGLALMAFTNSRKK